MFDNIAHKYDFLNHFLSFNIDKVWRKKAIKMLAPSAPKRILDVACGTADFSIDAYKRLQPEKIYGIDISEGMLAVGREKIQQKGLKNVITLSLGDAENIQFKTASFDAVTAAFGVRNFEHLSKGLSEMYRILRPGGEIIILEFSHPRFFLVKHLYNLYSYAVLPVCGRIFSKDSSAYSYLPESVQQFPDGKQFLEKLKRIGFSNCKEKTVSFGIASIYFAKKEN